MTYMWEKAAWPAFNWNNTEVLEPLVKARFEQGRLLAMAPTFVHSYEMHDTRRALFEDITQDGPLSRERLYGWQASLFPTGYSGIKKIRVGDLRTRNFGTPSLPFETLNAELDRYLLWWQEPPVGLDPVLRSGLAFFWFYLLSPFEAGNFEVASALAEKALHENEKTDVRPYDVAVQLEENRADVLRAIESAVRSDGDLTAWLLLYLDLYTQAVEAAYAIASQDQIAEKFWARNSALDLNRRQREVLNIMLLENREMTNRLYVELSSTSRESAKRDLVELVNLGLLKTGDKKGRSVSYHLI